MQTQHQEQEDDTTHEIQIEIDSSVASPEVESKTRELLTDHEIYQSTLTQLQSS